MGLRSWLLNKKLVKKIAMEIYNNNINEINVGIQHMKLLHEAPSDFVMIHPSIRGGHTTATPRCYVNKYSYFTANTILDPETYIGRFTSIG